MTARALMLAQLVFFAWFGGHFGAQQAEMTRMRAEFSILMSLSVRQLSEVEVVEL